MTKTRSCLRALSALWALAGSLLQPIHSQAQSTTYTVDPTQSRLTLSATFGGTFGWGQFTITNQVPGSLLDCWEGTIVANAEADGSLTFSGGSTIRARLNANSESPDPADPSFRPTQDDPGGPWSGIDNYGSKCFLYDNAAIHTAYRDLVLDITGGTARTAGSPASELTLQFIEGVRHWTVAALASGESKRVTAWPVSMGPSTAPRPVTLSADRAVLTIPVVLATKSFDNGIVTFEEIWTGTIVAIARTPGDAPPAPRVTLTPAGPAGLQFNTGGGTASHFNGITTAPWVECGWIGAASTEAPATFSFTVAAPPAPQAKGFLCYLWLVANPISYNTAAYSGQANPNVVRLNLEADGSGGVTATLGYRANAPDDDISFSTTGFICGITNAPFAGEWSLRMNSDTDLILTAPDGAQANGKMAEADAPLFREKVRLYLGVNPNGAANLGQSLTLSGARIQVPNSAKTSLNGVFDTGAKLDKNWTILAADPASLITVPAQSVYRAEWMETCPMGPGVNFLERSENVARAADWIPVAPLSRVLANGLNVTFLTEAETAGISAFFRVVVPGAP